MATKSWGGGTHNKMRCGHLACELPITIGGRVGSSLRVCCSRFCPSAFVKRGSQGLTHSEQVMERFIDTESAKHKSVWRFCRQIICRGYSGECLPSAFDIHSCSHDFNDF